MTYFSINSNSLSYYTPDNNDSIDNKYCDIELFIEIKCCEKFLQPISYFSLSIKVKAFIKNGSQL